MLDSSSDRNGGPPEPLLKMDGLLDGPLGPLSEQEYSWRRAAADFETRYCGHCNTTTDIKEANFFGRSVAVGPSVTGPPTGSAAASWT